MPYNMLNTTEGIRIASSASACAIDAIREVVSTAGVDNDIGFVLVFVSPHYDPDEIISGLRQHLPDIPYAGCSTAGEIGLEGIAHSSVVLVAFPRHDFRVVCSPLPALGDFGIEKAAELVSEMRRRLVPLPEETSESLFALTLLDGLCQCEEQILAALQYELADVPLVGGSSGDDLALRNTFVFQDGLVLREAGLLLLVHSSLPFRVFKSDHFEPTAKRMVVTACDPNARIVTELDANPAGVTFAEAIGIDPAALGSMSFASHPLLVRVGGDYYCRSIQKMNSDGSLSFYCAIDTGVVLTVAQTKDMVLSLEQALVDLDKELGGIDCVIGFDCVHRRLEAESRQDLEQISTLFRRFRVVGFSTYGEQYKAMHLNYTFTGIAFGKAGSQ